MTNQNNKQIVKTFKGKADLIFGIISFIIGLLIARAGISYNMWVLSYDDTGASIVKFGIFWVIVGIICLIHYGAKAPKVLYSDGTTGTLNRTK